MSLSNSKYFASVIAKLIAAKRQEQIHVDPQLKEDLRLEVLQRAQNGEWRASPDFFKEFQQDVPNLPEDSDYYEAPLSERIVDFFRRRRALLIVIPSALVLILVAAQIQNLPTFFKTDTDAPAGNDGGAETPVGNGNEDDASGIKTFPGALVMPEGAYPSKTEENRMAPQSLQYQAPQQNYAPTYPAQQSPSAAATGTASYGTTDTVYGASTYGTPSANTYNFFVPDRSVVPDRTGNLSDSSDDEDDTVTSHREIRWSDDDDEPLITGESIPAFSPVYSNFQNPIGTVVVPNRAGLTYTPSYSIPAAVPSPMTSVTTDMVMAPSNVPPSRY